MKKDKIEFVVIRKDGKREYFYSIEQVIDWIGYKPSINSGEFKGLPEMYEFTVYTVNEFNKIKK